MKVSTTPTDYSTIYNNDDSDSGTTIVAIALSLLIGVYFLECLRLFGNNKNSQKG